MRTLEPVSNKWPGVLLVPFFCINRVISKLQQLKDVLAKDFYEICPEHCPSLEDWTNSVAAVQGQHHQFRRHLSVSYTQMYMQSYCLSPHTTAFALKKRLNNILTKPLRNNVMIPWIK
jgi:hypothetical protein